MIFRLPLLRQTEIAKKHFPLRQPEIIPAAWRYGNRKRGARQDARSGKTAFQAALCAANSFYRLTASA